VRTVFISLLAAALLVLPRTADAYGVLAHEAIVDAAWADSIAPLLRSRFRASPAQLRHARAYAYGGSLIQDLGYYPFSSRTFGDLTHYVRSGDFIVSLLNGSSTVDELAFALGALAHYSADNNGHPLAVNRAVPLLYPKLRRAYGDSVTYEDKPSAHVRTEFAFDVVQVARGSYMSDAYRDFIGFEISKPALERAFLETYGLELDDVFGEFELAVGTFRYAVSTMIPKMTRVAWKQNEDQIFSFTRAEYEKTFGTRYKRPGIGSAFLAFVIRIIPKIGPFSALAFKLPTPETQRLFEDSFGVTVNRYKALIRAASDRRVTIRNLNFDTGQPIRAGDYELADKAYADLLDTLRKTGFQNVSAGLRGALVDFFAEPQRSPFLRSDPKRLRAVSAEIAALKSQAVSLRQRLPVDR
jgi:hypothetical protein